MWQQQRWLKFSCYLMVGVFAANLVGLLVDPRTITGSPTWLKPAKFSFSVAVYVGSLAWILSKITIWPRFLRRMGDITACALLIEIFIINLQAWRGTTSHFNFHTKLDAALFATMGFFIGLLWLASAGVAVALFRQTFENRSFGWALRLGMLITVLGSASGGLMTRAMPDQVAGVVGSHTVGGIDGGAGMVITKWSADHGDLRVGHFFGLHGMQIIPFLYWLLARRQRPSVAVISIAAANYFGAFVLLEWQALRGQSILQPDSMTLYCWLAWLTLSAGGVLLASVSTGRNSLQTAVRVA